MSTPLVDETVCVTGASGFIGSWIVSLLLQRGYHVRGCVQNLGDERETKHLQGLAGADKRLQLFQADLLDYESLGTAIGNSNGVFHVASPCLLEKVDDPQRVLIDPAVKGTLNVLKAAHAAQVKRVVVTSSICALYPNPKMPPGTVVDENWWTDIDFCKEKGAWYPVSKTLAEKAAWEFAAQTGLDVVTIQPACVFGRMLHPRLNTSAAVMLNLLKGSSESMEVEWIGGVDVQDVARAQILLYENPSAQGRYQCTEAITHFSDFAEQVAHMYPQYNVHRFEEETQPGLVRCSNPSKKLMGLGFVFTPLENAIRDAVSSLQELGYLTA